MRKLLALGAMVLLASLGLADLAEPATAATLLGTTTVSPNVDRNDPGVAEAFRTTATASGPVSTMTVYVNSTSTATKLVVGLYTNVNNHPGTLLTQGSMTSPVKGAWNEVAVPTATVASGGTYWIAVLGPSGVLSFRDQLNTGNAETHAVGGLSAMPSSWQTGTTYRDGRLSAYGTDVGTPPALGVTPATLSFGATTGGADPSSKTISVANTGGGTLAYTTSTDASWLTASPASGTAPGTVTVTPKIAGLAAGTYDGTVIVASGGASGSPQTVAVRLTITDPPPPTLAVTPASLSFSATTGGADPAPKTVAVSNTGGGTLSFTTSTDAQWLAASPASGTAPANVSVAPKIDGLAAGTYDGTVVVASGGANGSPQTVPVRLVLTDPAPPPPPPPADAADWLQVDHDPARTGNAVGETAIGTAQAPNLAQAWSTQLDGKVTAQPLYVAGITVGSQTRNLLVAFTNANSAYALDADTGAVVWRRTFGAPRSNCAVPGGLGITAPGAIDKSRGRIYTVSEDGVLRTLALADGTDAAPGVTVISDWVTNRVWGGLNLSGSTLRIATASDGCDSQPWRGRILNVDVSGAAPVVAKRWDVVPGIAPPSGGGGIWGYGGIAVDHEGTGNVYAATGADNVEAYTAYADRIVGLSPGLDVLGSYEPFHPAPGSYPCTGDPCDVDFGSSPVVFKPAGCPTMVSTGNKNGLLYIAKASTIDGSGNVEQIIQLNPANDWLGSGGVGGVPAWSPDLQMLFVSTVGPGWGGVAGGMVGLKANADCTFSVAWSQTLGVSPNPDSTPTVANGVVYVGEGGTGRLHAFNARTGAVLFRSAGGGGAYAAPTVANGTVYLGTWDGFGAANAGSIKAFRPGTPPPPQPSVLLGSENVETQSDQNALGTAEAFQATGRVTGTTSRLSVYVDSTSTTTKLTAGIYADNGAGTHPGALLAQGSITTITNGAWNAVPIPATQITAGTRYWIAILGTVSGTLRFKDGSGRCKGETSSNKALTALPATWATGIVYSDCPLSGYAPGD